MACWFKCIENSLIMLKNYASVEIQVLLWCFKKIHYGLSSYSTSSMQQIYINKFY